MALKYNSENVTNLIYNSQVVNELKKDGTIVWERPFSYTQGTLPTGVASLVCNRNSTSEPTSSTGTVVGGATIYYKDNLSFSATATTGYSQPTCSSISSVSTNVTGTDYVTPGSVLSYTLTKTISGVAEAFTATHVYRTSSPLAGASIGELSSGATIYYGDVLETSFDISSSTAWSPTTIITPSQSSKTDSTIILLNNDSQTVDIVNSTTGTKVAAVYSGATATFSSLSPATTYTFYASGWQSRTIYSGSCNIQSISVTGDVSIVFTGTSDLESQTLNSSTISITTEATATLNAPANLSNITCTLTEDSSLSVEGTDLTTSFSGECFNPNSVTVTAHICIYASYRTTSTSVLHYKEVGYLENVTISPYTTNNFSQDITETFKASKPQLIPFGFVKIEMRIYFTADGYTKSSTTTYTF